MSCTTISDTKGYVGINWKVVWFLKVQRCNVLYNGMFWTHTFVVLKISSTQLIMSTDL